MNETSGDWRVCTWYGELTIRSKTTQLTMLIIITQQQHQNNGNIKTTAKTGQGHRQVYGVAFH
jgi:hypothetical protein